MLLKKTKTIERQTVTTATKGLATDSWMRIPTTSAEVKAETTSILYDYKYRPIRSYTTNYLGGYTYTDSKLDAFSGQLQYTIQKHKRTTGDSELVVKDTFTYTAQDRLIQHTHQINGGAEQLLAENTYDELGQLISKKVGNTSATPLQKVDYSYNIRGWMTAINSIANLNVGTDPADLFGFKLNYNIVEGSATAADKLYNGNIAETFWSTATDGGFVRNYGYKYDNLNRLKDATYQKSGQLTNMYNENLTYDKNGNIMNLSRYGDRDEQYLPIQIDNLGYNYGTNSNQLKSVTDATNNTSGFKDGNTTGDDYVYDANGNMTVDKNKNITGIVYNHLNLPTKIIFPTGNIVYIYTASGQKMQKIVTDGTNTTTTDYLGGYQYRKKNASEPVELQFFPTAEGYVKNTPVSGANSYSYVFNYTDHLGNTRLSYTKDTTTGSLKILEENNYYPFGMKHNGYNPISPIPENRRLFNGKELQEELGLNQYDYGARNYDPALGRWMNVDPLAHKLPSYSPYAYCLNNPISMVDPDGAFPIEIHVRSFAPFNYFGGGLWKGDGANRGFSTIYSGNTSRIRQITSYETTTMASSSTAYGGQSHSRYGANAFSDAKIEDDFSFGNRIYTHLSGDNDALVPGVDYGGPTHDIDVWTDVHIGVSENKDGSSILSLTGDLAGDGFPSSEAFVTDGSGKNKVFLGVGAAKAGPNKGPFVTLAGDKKEKQFDINVRIAVDKKGNFIGVYSTDKKGKETIVTIADWNKQFESQSPK
ncbi:RHS repeat domain-containing protein [Flavobacterium sp.]|uniref:RHS repeat domain-containing protein n=1 Tax=Flavobacterium sp. TaxID=239 RepID=UPI0035B2D949